MGDGMSRTLNLAASTALLLVVGCRRADADGGTPPASYFDKLLAFLRKIA